MKREIATAIVVVTLALVIIAVISVFLVGLFSPQVDNDKVFAILGPAFDTIVGAFVGVLSSKMLNDDKKDDPK